MAAGGEIPPGKPGDKKGPDQPWLPRSAPGVALKISVIEIFRTFFHFLPLIFGVSNPVSHCPPLPRDEGLTRDDLLAQAFQFRSFNRAPPACEATLLQSYTPNFHGKCKGKSIFGPKLPFSYAPRTRRSGGPSTMHLRTYFGGGVSEIASCSQLGKA